jgi:hypothetical protein
VWCATVVDVPPAIVNRVRAKHLLTRAERAWLPVVADRRSVSAIIITLAQHYRANAHPHASEHWKEGARALEKLVEQLSDLELVGCLNCREASRCIALDTRVGLLPILLVLADHFWDVAAMFVGGEPVYTAIANAIEIAINEYSGDDNYKRDAAPVRDPYCRCP